MGNRAVLHDAAVDEDVLRAARRPLLGERRDVSREAQPARLLVDFDEVAALGRTALATTLSLLIIDLVWPGTRPAPASSVIAAGFLAVLAMCGTRYAARQMLENRRRFKPDPRRTHTSAT